MTTVRSRPLNRYHNEVVFRSAEQLIAWRPPRKLLPRWLVFLLGMAAGVVLMGILVINPGARLPWSVSLPLTPRPFGSVVDSPAQPQSDAVKAPATAAVTPARTEKSSAATRPRITATTSAMTLRGELFSKTAAPLSVELTLRRSENSQQVTGAIRYFENGVCVALYDLKGSLSDTILSVHETGNPWIMRSIKPVVNQSIFTGSRTLTIALPELVGSWVQGRTAGTLRL